MMKEWKANTINGVPPTNETSVLDMGEALMKDTLNLYEFEILGNGLVRSRLKDGVKEEDLKFTNGTIAVYGVK